MGYTSDSGMGSSTIIGGAILLVLLFGIFGGWGRGFGGNCGGGCGCGHGHANDFLAMFNNSRETERDLWESQCNISKQVLTAQNENQLLISQLGQRLDNATATIATKMDANEIGNLRDQISAERSERIAANAKIDALQLQIANNAQFNEIRSQLCALSNAVAKTVQTPPFTVCGTYNPCNSCCNNA